MNRNLARKEQQIIEKGELGWEEMLQLVEEYPWAIKAFAERYNTSPDHIVQCFRDGTIRPSYTMWKAAEMAYRIKHDVYA